MKVKSIASVILLLSTTAGAQDNYDVNKGTTTCKGPATPPPVSTDTWTGRDQFQNCRFLRKVSDRAHAGRAGSYVRPRA